MTNNALIPIADMRLMADSIVKSRFYGFKNIDEVLAVMLVAQAENKHPATVVQEYDIIQGRPALKSSAALARFQVSGGKVQWDEVSPAKAKGTFTHPAGGTLSIEWTIEMAKKAGLMRPGSGWEKYPEDMLCARVAARAIRKVYPACLTGSYLVEEVVDFDRPLNGGGHDIAPPAIPAPPAPVTPASPVIEGKAEPAKWTMTLKADEPPPLPSVERNEWPLMVPNMAQPYTICTSPEEWRDYYNALVEKIERSRKYQEAEKTEKVAKLLDSNRPLYESLPDEIRNQIQTSLEG